MIAKENTRPAGRTAERVAGEETGRASSIPVFNSTTLAKHEQGPIEAILTAAGAFGEENALTAKELTQQSGLSDCRVTRLAVSEERQGGAVILSGDFGYCLPAPGVAGKAEIRAFVARLESQAWHTHLAVRSAQNALDSLDGQMTL